MGARLGENDPRYSLDNPLGPKLEPRPLVPALCTSPLRHACDEDKLQITGEFASRTLCDTTQTSLASFTYTISSVVALRGPFRSAIYAIPSGFWNGVDSHVAIWPNLTAGASVVI